LVGKAGLNILSESACRLNGGTLTQE
jgi:hypothetical protein